MGENGKNVITGLFAVIFGAVMYFGVTPRFVVTTDALNHTSPDTFPNFISVVMILLGIVLLVKTYFEQRNMEKEVQKEEVIHVNGEKKLFTSSGGYYAAATFIDMIVFVVFFEKIGYVASSIIACCGLLAAYKSKKWYYYVTVIAFTLVLNYIFSVVLHVKMP